MKNFSLLFIISYLFFSCQYEEKWTVLLSDNDLEGWHYYNDNGNKFGWSVSDGVLSFDPSLAEYQRDSLGNILTHDNGSLKKRKQRPGF